MRLDMWTAAFNWDISQTYETWGDCSVSSDMQNGRIIWLIWHQIISQLQNIRHEYGLLLNITTKKLPSESVSQDWPFTAPPGFLFIETGNLRESGAFLKRYPTKFYHPNFDLVDVHWSPGNYIESMRREMCRISEMGNSFWLGRVHFDLEICQGIARPLFSCACT